MPKRRWPRGVPTRPSDRLSLICGAELELLRRSAGRARIGAYDAMFNRTSRIRPVELTAKAQVRIPSLGDVHDASGFYVLGALTQLVEPSTVFEFGTYQGRGAETFAANSSARVFTLDLPPGDIVDANEWDVALMKQRLAELRPTIGEIERLYADSREFDFSLFHHQIDLVYVDGGHDEDVVMCDTRNALSLLKNNGTIVWDDYGWMYPGVVTVLDELLSSHPTMRRIEGTRLVVLTFNADLDSELR